MEYRSSLYERKGQIVYVYLLSIVAALGGLLFGYDTAVISGAIGFLQTRFDLNNVWMGWAASCALIGCIGGASIAGWMSDRYGRRSVLILSGMLFTVSAIGSAFPRSLTEFVIARIIGGVGVGIASMLSPLYIAEVAPARLRGRLVTLNQFTIVFGMLVVYFVNALVASMGDEAWNIAMGWRWMFGSEVLPAVLFMVLLLFVPESPRWL
ncbi:MAG: MFS transporter, partial [Planctomycetes bacterium]|nr:MFS transporter [Planctomycetota bacterium]